MVKIAQKTQIITDPLEDFLVQNLRNEEEEQPIQEEVKQTEPNVNQDQSANQEQPELIKEEPKAKTENPFEPEQKSDPEIKKAQNIREMRQIIKNERAKSNELSQKLSEYEKRIQELESKLNESSQITPKLQEYEKRISEYESALERYSVENTPRFKATQSLIQEAQDKIKNIFEENNADYSLLQKALETKDPVERKDLFVEALEDLDTLSRTRVASALDRIDSLKAEQDKMRQNAKQILESEEAEYQRALKEKQERFDAEAAQARHNVFLEMQKAYPKILNHIEGNKEHNDWVDGLEDAAKEFLESPQIFNNHELRERLVLLGLAAPRMIEYANNAIKALIEERDALQSKLEDMYSGAPQGSSSVRSASSENKSWKEFLEETIK